MKHFFQLSIILITCSTFPSELYAQDCQSAAAHEFLFGNQIRTPFHTGGDMFWNLTEGQFFVPSFTDETKAAASTFLAAALWVGGLDPAGNLQMAAQTYRQNGNDFWPGPLDENGLISTDICADYDRIWRAPEYAVAAHIADFADGTIDNPIDLHLKQWPAKGNPYFFDEFGFELPLQDLAPFVDANTDGLYDPADGDYPCIDPAWPNIIAADLLWMVFNDKGNIHSETGGSAIGLEVQLTAYAFHCDKDSILDRTIFTKHKLINKNENELFDAYASIWADFDLGCWDDDFIGSAPELNTFYAYNGTNNDYLFCSDFTFPYIGYGVNPPAQAVTFLNQDLSSFVYFHNSTSVQGNPDTPDDFYNYMRGIWRDDTPIEFGGDGYAEGTFTTPFMFPDDPNDTNPGSWSEVSLNNLPEDRRGVGSIGPFNLPSSSSITIDAAYSFHWDTTRSNLGNVSFMYENVPKIQALYDSGFAPTTSRCAPAPACLSDCVWPGDTDTDGTISHLDIINLGIANSISGSSRTGTAWQPYTVVDWTNDFFDGTNYKHGDCDGNGTVTADDLAIIDLNYGRVNAYFDGTVGLNNQGSHLMLSPNMQGTFNDTVVPGQNIQLKVIANEDNPIQNIHGIGFSVGTDENLVELQQAIPFSNMGGLNDDFTAISLYRNTDTDPFKTRVEFGATRIDGIGKTISGDLLNYRFWVADDIFDYLPTNAPYIHITIENMRIAQPDGTGILNFGSTTYSLYVHDPALDIKNIPSLQLSISPNPTRDVIRVVLDKGKAESVILHDALGRLVHRSSPQSTHFEVKVGHLATGIYFLSVEQDGRWAREKILVL